MSQVTPTSASAAPRLAPPISSATLEHRHIQVEEDQTRPASSSNASLGLQRRSSADAACPPCEPIPAPSGDVNQSNSNSVGRSRPARRKLTIIPPITHSALDDLSMNHPAPIQSPGRRRAHTIGVSLRPRGRTVSAADAEAREDDDELAPLSTAGRRLPEGDLESGLGGSTRNRRRSGSTSSGGPTTVSVPRRTSLSSGDGTEAHGQLNDEVVGLLDVIDPHVATVNHLQNMTNSVLVPHIPSLWKRRPEVQLPEAPSDESLAEKPSGNDQSTVAGRLRSMTGRSRRSSELPSNTTDTRAASVPMDELPRERPRGESAAEVEAMEMEEDIMDIKEDHQLDKHVKNVLRQSKRAKAKQILKGVWTFVKTPMGAITAIYGFLVAFWGAGIVLFLLGWIPTSSKDRKSVWVEICSQVENGLFTVTGVGLIPWRAMDTYRMSVIWTLREKSRRLRKKQGLPPIEDPDDLPDPELIKDFVDVLSEKDRKKLRYNQEKFAASQTWYKPHATATHRAFPMKWALWNTILMDGNSFFQCLLCGCMWGLTWRERPAWTTGTLIPLSFLCGIGAAVLIWQGSARTKKTPTVSEKLREALGVPLAIGVPRTADGTVLSSNTNEAPATDIPLHQTQTTSKAGGPKSAVGTGRRSTVTFGDVPDHMGYDGDGKRGEGEKSRGRATTVAAPERGARRDGSLFESSEEEADGEKSDVSGDKEGKLAV